MVSVEVANVGETTLELNGLLLDDVTGSFSTTELGDGALEPEEFTHFIVTYEPVDYSGHLANIEVYSSDPNGCNEQTVDKAGNESRQ